MPRAKPTVNRSYRPGRGPDAQGQDDADDRDLSEAVFWAAEHEDDEAAVPPNAVSRLLLEEARENREGFLRTLLKPLMLKRDTEKLKQARMTDDGRKLSELLAYVQRRREEIVAARDAVLP